ncbi:MAG: hypothetical protein Q7S52_02555 [bacterium]|nr:hypothetical protein [bacterium]
MQKSILERSDTTSKWFPEKARIRISDFLDTRPFREYKTWVSEYLSRLLEKRESWKCTPKIKTADLAEWLRKEGWKRIREGWRTKNESFVEQGNILRRIALMLDKIAVSYSTKNGRRKP